MSSKRKSGALGASGNPSSSDKRSSKNISVDVNDTAPPAAAEDGATTSTGNKTHLTASAPLQLMVCTPFEGFKKLEINLAMSDPTCADLRNAICLTGKFGMKFGIIALGKSLDKCYVTLSSLNIVSSTPIHIISRFGGNPCSTALEDKHESQLFVVPHVGAEPIEWGLDKRNKCAFHFCDCELRRKPQFPVHVITSTGVIVWRVEQDCYCLNQSTFHSGNIAVWRMDSGDQDPYPVKSTKLSVKPATSGYDLNDQSTDDDASGFCVVTIEPPTHGWAINGVYEFRLNAPSAADLKDHLDPYFHITGFEGKHSDHTRYRHSLAVKFVSSQSSSEYVRSVAAAVECLSHVQSANSSLLIHAIVAFLFS